MKKKYLFIIILISIFVRIYSNNWGIVHYEAEQLPEGVYGTIYTYMPDEKEFLGCYRALGWSASKVFKDMPFIISSQTVLFTLKNIINGNLTFAPVYPTTLTPLMSYIVFFISVPIIGLKYLLNFYPVFNSNIIFSEALLIGRYVTAFFNILSIFYFYKILELFNVKKIIKYFGLIIWSLLPAFTIVSHYLSYNTLVVFFEIASLYYLINYVKTSNSKFLVFASILIGLGLATKLTAVTLLPIYILAILLSSNNLLSLNNHIIIKILKSSIIIVITYLLISMYGIFTQYNEYSISLPMYLDNLFSSPNVSLIIPKTLLLRNLYLNTLPTGFSISIYLLFIISFFYFIYTKNIIKSKPLIIIYSYLLIWLIGVSFSSLNMLMRLLSINSIGVLIVCLLLNDIKSKKIIYFIVIIIVINLIIDNTILLKYYSSKDIRVESSEWINRNIKKNNTIGVIYDFPYWYSPEIMFTDYFWNKNKIYDYKVDIIKDDILNDCDYIIIAKCEFQAYFWKNQLPLVDIIQFFNENNFKLKKIFFPDLSLWFFNIQHENDYFPSHNIFVSDIYIFKRKI